MTGEVLGCQQVDIGRHRWYVDIRITLEDGTDVHKVYAAGPDGIEEYASLAEFRSEFE
jgi:hypothetical protein